MTTNNYFGQMLETVLKDYLKNEKEQGNSFFGFTTFKMLGFNLREVKDGSFGNVSIYDCLIYHKAKKWEDNCYAFQIMLYEDGSAVAMFNGCAYLSEKDGMTIISNSSVHYGSFSEEMATEWLNKIAMRMDKEAY